MQESPPNDDDVYRTSTFSNTGACVAVCLTRAAVKVRHSRGPEQGTLVFSHAEWAAFVAGVRVGEFDLPNPPEQH